MTKIKQKPIDSFLKPIRSFMGQEKSGSIILGIAVILALIIANSPLAEYYFNILDYKLGLYFEGKTYFELTILDWVNDALMAVFFFLVGLELKRELVAGELKEPRKAMLPIVAAMGGMIVPALIYYGLNSAGDAHHGWGIPMATDIAFALGVVYLLGDRVPTSLKVFLAALAIIDDLGAVIVIALFYSSEISFLALGIGAACLVVIILANRLGVKSIAFYAIIGIGGVWSAFLLSGVHATIAAVCVAFAMPMDVHIKEDPYIKKMKKLLDVFKGYDPDNESLALKGEQLQVLNEIKKTTNSAIPITQRLESSIASFVTFFVIPIFALANAGVSLLDISMDGLFGTNVAIGVFFGLLVGKVIGVFGFTYAFIKLKIASWPTGMNPKNLLGTGLLAGIGFTMSLFVTSLAFDHPEYEVQAKVGIFAASIIAGVLGYMLLSRTSHSTEKKLEDPTSAK